LSEQCVVAKPKIDRPRSHGVARQTEQVVVTAVNVAHELVNFLVVAARSQFDRLVERLAIAQQTAQPVEKPASNTENTQRQIVS
jgi:hypothetical protein